jgi:membrane fusion protein (multidrug efflux system)
MWFYSNVSEVDYVRTKTRAEELGKDLNKLPLTLILPDGREHKEPGKLVFFDRAVNVKTGTLRIRAEFPNPTELLRPGMFARARVEAGTREGIQIPERAIFELQGKSFVWVVDAGQKAQRRPIRPGEPNGSNIVILDGLKPGERIVVEGVAKVRDGQPVTVHAAGPEAAPKPAAAGESPTTR